MSNSISYKVGRWASKNMTVLLVVGALAFAIVVVAKDISTSNTAPPTSQTNHAPAAPKKTATNPLDKMCGEELESRTNQAKDALKHHDLDHAWELMEPCNMRLQPGTDAFATYIKITNEFTKQTEKRRAEDEKKDLAERKKHGVTIGMTEYDVLHSNWGKPTSINRTTNAYGVREQWVYGGGNYLYFKDGVLTSIQN